MKNTFYYQNFIFDLDGTLVDSIQDIANAVNYAFSIYSLPKRALEEFPDYLGDGSVNLIKRALKDICVSNEKFHEIFNTYYQYYMNHFVVKTHAYDGLWDALLQAKHNGIKLFVYSNKPDKIAKIVVSHCFPDGLFDKVVGIPLNGKVKPAPDAFFQETYSYSIDFSRTAYFGDSGTDIITAKNLNISNIYSVLWGYKSESFLRAFRPQPKGFLKNPSEIKRISMRLCD